MNEENYVGAVWFLRNIIEAHNADVVKLNNDIELYHLSRRILGKTKWCDVYEETYYGDPFRLYRYEFDGFMAYAYVFCEMSVALVVRGAAGAIALVSEEHGSRRI